MSYPHWPSNLQPQLRPTMRYAGRNTYSYLAMVVGLPGLLAAVMIHVTGPFTLALIGPGLMVAFLGKSRGERLWKHAIVVCAGYIPVSVLVRIVWLLI